MTSNTEERVPKKPLSGWRGWVFIAVIIGLGAMGKWGAATHNGLLQLVGFGPIFTLLVVAVIWSRRKAARDPEFAAKLAESKALAEKRAIRKISGLFVALILALAAVVLVNLARKGWPSIYSLPQGEQITTAAILAFAALVVIRMIMNIGRTRDLH